MLDDPQFLLLLVVLQNVVFIVLTVGLFWIGVFVARRFGSGAGYSLRSLGLARPRPGFLRGAGLGLLVGVVVLIGSLGVNAISAAVAEGFGYPPENAAQEPFFRSIEAFVAEDPVLAVPVVISVIMVFGPAVEELVFRGAVFGGLYRLGLYLMRRGSLLGKEPSSAGRWFALGPAAVLSSVLFALLHFSPVILPTLFLLALALCWLYERTGSLLPNVVAHATFNAFAVAALVLSGLGVLDLPGH